jgi:hypothetical protein
MKDISIVNREAAKAQLSLDELSSSGSYLGDMENHGG